MVGAARGGEVRRPRCLDITPGPQALGLGSLAIYVLRSERNGKERRLSGVSGSVISVEARGLWRADPSRLPRR